MALERTIVNQLINSYPLISEQVDRQEIKVILSELYLTLEQNTSGSVVEFGCYIGTTSLFMRRMLDSFSSTKDFHVYDSFVGLPSKTVHDSSPAGEQFRVGELSVSRKEFELQFKKANLRLPRVHKGWFSELQPHDVPDRISFAYLDGDYYESIKDSLQLVWPRLSKGSRIVVDDYANEALPGSRIAVDEWLREHAGSVRHEASLGIITPRIN